MEENMQTTTASTTDEATKANVTTENSQKYIKEFENEDAYNSFMKSESMKKVNDLYSEFNIKSKADIKAAFDNSEKYAQILKDYDKLQKEFDKYKTDIDTANKEKETLNRKLVMQKLSVSDDEDTAADFIAGVESLMSRKEIDFEKAAEEYINKYPAFKKSLFNTTVKIGVDKTGISDEPLTGVEKAFMKSNPWYKKK